MPFHFTSLLLLLLLLLYLYMMRRLWHYFYDNCAKHYLYIWIKERFTVVKCTFGDSFSAHCYGPGCHKTRYTKQFYFLQILNTRVHSKCSNFYDVQNHYDMREEKSLPIFLPIQFSTDCDLRTQTMRQVEIV